MGLGKTIQVLALLVSRQRDTSGATALLVVPASLIANWVAEIERFAPTLRTLVAHPSAHPTAELSALDAAEVARHDVVITSYGYVSRLAWAGDIDWDIVVADEAQALKNPRARQTRATKALRSRTRVALTGTPVENRLADLWSLFDFINPGLLGSAQAFKRFANLLAERERDRYAPLRELIRPYLLRRLKTDRRIIADLPDKTEVVAHCSLTRVQASLYQQSVDQLAEQLSPLDGIQRRGVVLSFLTRFKQICNHPSQWLGDGAFAARDSGKFARLREICEEVAARQEKALVFTQFREMTEPLAAFLADVFGRPGLILSGDTAVAKRRGLVDRFQNDEAVPFFVLSLKAGGTGLNLTAASHVIHFDRWWNPAVENQATDRAFRIGQNKNVLVHKFLCRGTVEEKIDAILRDKQSLSDELVESGGEAMLTELSTDELIRVVSLDVSRALSDP
jgi:non-specific serine/threonine protein kinase